MRSDRKGWFLLMVLPFILEGQDSAMEMTYPCHCEWQEVETENRPTARHENAFVSDGSRFYLIGGRGEKPVDIYDPETKQWREGATPPIEIHHFQPVVHAGKIYVLGAMTGGFPREEPVDRVLVYDPEADSWSWGATIPEHRRRGAAGAVVHEGIIYLVSGIVDGHWDGHVTWFDAFDPETGEWNELPDAPRARDHFQAAVVSDKLYAAGGRRSSRHEDNAGTWRHVVAPVDVYDFAEGEWSTLESPEGDLPTPRAGTSSVAFGRFLIVIGGETWENSDAHDAVEAFDTAAGQWHPFPALETPRHGTGAVVHDHGLYIAAGNRTRGGGAEEHSLERIILGPPDDLRVGEGGLLRAARVETTWSESDPLALFSFRRAEEEPGVVVVEESDNLEAWSAVWMSDRADDLEEATVAQDPDGTRSLEVQVELPGAERRFVRLRSEPPE